MAIRLDELNQLDPDAVSQEQATLAQQLQEALPSLDLRRGLLHDLLLNFSAILATKNQVEQSRLQQSMSVAAILADPTLADEETVDNIASNYRVTRQAGSTAGGAVTIIVSVLQDVTISVGAIFDARSKGFVTEQVYTGRASNSNVVDATDKLLVPRGDGTYEFRINVAAMEVGNASRLVKGTALVPRTLPPNFVAAVVAEDFIGGLNTEDNATLVNRFATGLTTKAISSRANMAASVREQFTTVLNDSIIGFGDAELLRARHSLLPVSLGNRADWYIQTQELYRSIGITKSAVLMELTDDGYGIWQMSFGRDEYPGLYTVSVKPTGSRESLGEFAITDLVRGIDLTAIDGTDGFVPDVVTTEEAAFSRFQTVIVRFKDTLTTTSSLIVGTSSQDYSVTVRVLPLIAEIQDYMLQRGVRGVTGDLLVKAPVPCFLGLSFTVQLMPGQAEPDAELIKDDLAQFVNNSGFLGQLPASALLDIIHNHLEDDAFVTETDMVARLHYPDGTISAFRDSELLTIPYSPADLVTARTTLFFLDPADASITYKTADILQVL